MRVSGLAIVSRNAIPAAISNNEIVVDSRASEYVVSDITLLRDVQQVPDIQVELSNGVSINYGTDRSAIFEYSVGTISVEVRVLHTEHKGKYDILHQII